MAVATIETNITCTKFDYAEEFGLCPRCGAVMDEMDRLDEGLYTYIWLKCSKSDCDGQWLQKKPRQWSKRAAKNSFSPLKASAV